MASQPASAKTPADRVAILPTTTLGWVAFVLALAYFMLMTAWMFVPGGAGLAFLAGTAGGIVALVAILRRAERAVMVFAALVPPVLVVLFFAAEPLVQH